jgi:MFS family permease
MKTFAYPQPTALPVKTFGLVTFFATYTVHAFYVNTANIVQPQIAADLNGVPLYAWSFSIPVLVGAIATLMFSKLAEIYGRKNLLLLSLVLFFSGAVLASLSQTYIFFIAARSLLTFGQGAIAPLTFSGIGELFSPVERSKWSGLMNIPAGISALLAPTLIGLVIDNSSWRYYFWVLLILLVIAFFLVVICLPSPVKRESKPIDTTGAVFLAAASGALILLFSTAGSIYPWSSPQIILLCVLSFILWVAFFAWEKRSPEPLLDPQVFVNRTFLTAAVAAMLSIAGITSTTVYLPLFIQGVQGVSATQNGMVITPFSMLTAFMGVPAGIFLAKTRRYKWIYIFGYGTVTTSMFLLVTFSAATPIWLLVVVTTVAGIGQGVIPTVNTLIAQFALPKRLFSIGVGAMFFFVLMGNSMTPSILGSVMVTSYSRQLQVELSLGVRQKFDSQAFAAIGNPRVLISPSAMNGLQQIFVDIGEPALFDPTVSAIRSALDSGLNAVFLAGAIMMAASFLLILTIPEVAICEDSETN